MLGLIRSTRPPLPLQQMGIYTSLAPYQAMLLLCASKGRLVAYVPSLLVRCRQHGVFPLDWVGILALPLLVTIDLKYQLSCPSLACPYQCTSVCVYCASGRNAVPPLAAVGQPYTRQRRGPRRNNIYVCTNLKSQSDIIHSIKASPCVGLLMVRPLPVAGARVCVYDAAYLLPHNQLLLLGI
jgi:hypothetical protein